jgi:AcrR family transcriptional regulator
MAGRPRTVADEEILAATARAISRVGPARLTLGDVAGEAGLAPATLMQRFGSKRNLLLAFAATASAGVEEAFARSRAAHPSPLAALLADPLDAAGVMTSAGALAHHLAFLQLELADPEFHAHALAHARAVRAQTRRLLDDAVAAGELVPCDTARLADAVQVAYNGALITWAVFRRGRLGPALRRHVAFVLAPYRR